MLRGKKIEGKPVFNLLAFQFFSEITVPWSQSGWSLDGILYIYIYIYIYGMYICTLEKIDMETFKMKVSKMIAVCLIVENFRFCVILRGCRSILDIIYIYMYIYTHILTYNIPGSSQLVYQFAVFQFSSPPKNIGSTRAEEIFCRKEFFLSSAVWGWSSGYVSRPVPPTDLLPSTTFPLGYSFFWGGEVDTAKLRLLCLEGACQVVNV